LLVCVSLGRLLSIESAEEDRPVPGGQPKARESLERMLVTSWEGSRLVFPVDEVAGLQKFDLNSLREPPATVSRAQLSFTRRVIVWRDHSVGVLDPAALFHTLDRSLT
jgi:chemotaxis-related protein WspD